MIDPELLEILACPETREKLALADAELVAQVNAAIRAGRLRNRGGTPLSEPIDGGLVRADGALLYPIQDDIPVLLVEEAIELPLAAAEGPPAGP